MSSNVQVTFLTDDTVRVEAVIKDFDGALTDPDEQYVYFYDPNDTVMATVTPSKVGLGTFTADYSIPASGTAGIWKADWRADFAGLGGTYPAREVIKFLVGEP